MASLMDSVMQNSSTQKVSISDTSAKTTDSVKGNGTYSIIELYGTSAFHFAEGVVASTDDAPYPAGQVITKKINSGSKCAFVKQSGEADGTVYVTKVV